MTENPSFGRDKSRTYPQTPEIQESKNTEIIGNLVSDLERRFGDFPEVIEYIDEVKQRVQNLQESNIKIPPAVIKILDNLPKRKIIPKRTIEDILSI